MTYLLNRVKIRSSTKLVEGSGGFPMFALQMFQTLTQPIDIIAVMGLRANESHVVGLGPPSRYNIVC